MILVILYDQLTAHYTNLKWYFKNSNIYLHLYPNSHFKLQRRKRSLYYVNFMPFLSIEQDVCGHDIPCKFIWPILHITTVEPLHIVIVKKKRLFTVSQCILCYCNINVFLIFHTHTNVHTYIRIRLMRQCLGTI